MFERKETNKQKKIERKKGSVKTPFFRTENNFKINIDGILFLE